MSILVNYVRARKLARGDYDYDAVGAWLEEWEADRLQVRAERDRYRAALEEIVAFEPGVWPDDELSRIDKLARAALATQPTTEDPQRG